MGVVPENLKVNDSPYIKGEEFEKGVVLKVKGFEIVKSKDPAYGATDKDWTFTSGKLKVGETFRYVFETIPGDDPEDFPVERLFESKSAPFFIAYAKVDPEVGDNLHIVRKGSGKNTEYLIDKTN